MRSRARLVLVLVFIIMSPVACSVPQRLGLSRAASPTPSLPPTELPTPQDTSLPPTEEPTSRPTAEPTDTRCPTPTPPEPSRIKFDPGETSVSLAGHLDDRETDRYVLYAREGQTMEVVVEAPKKVGLAIQAADGIPLKRRVDEEMSWHGELPASQDTFIEVSSIKATDYTLTVTILPAFSEASIEVIEPNGGEVWLEGSTHAIRWRSSGVAKVTVEAASGGKPWIIAVDVDATAGRLPWEIPVGLISNFGVAASDAMRVRVSSSAEPHLYDENDEPFTVRCPRIQFEPGTVSSVVTGTLDAGGGSYRYALGASAGQTMTIEISPARVAVDVWGAEDGSTWQVSKGQAALTIASLPATQDYFVTLTNPSPSDVVSYRLGVVIR